MHVCACPLCTCGISMHTTLHSYTPEQDTLQVTEQDKTASANSNIENGIVATSCMQLAKFFYNSLYIIL